MTRTLLLLIVIILEGYVVLSTELLAIRETIPYVGSGTDTVSIIIAAVLMPLAFGYFAGGHFRPYIRNGKAVSIRKKLISNILIAQVFLIFGLSYLWLNLFFYGLIGMGIKHRLFLTALYSVLFLVTPVYLLGQTIPLISHYFSKEKLSEITGRVLFLSTMGSFMGAVFSTLVLMATIGVHNTVSFSIILLAVLVILLSKKKISDPVIYAVGLAIAGMMVNSSHVMDIFQIVENNQYNTVIVDIDEEGNRHLVLNHQGSSMYNDKGRKHEYIEFAERQTIAPILNTSEPKDILVIGAGAFTFGLEDRVNNYEFVDLDGSLQKISEEYILRQKLTPNKKFIPMEARAFLAGTDKKFDVIFLDAYLGGITIPEHLVTQDFYKQVKSHLKDHGIVAWNFIASASFSTPFSRHVDNTLRSVFPHVSRHAVMEDYELWMDDPRRNANVVYLYKNHPDEQADAIYTDDRNRIFYDKPQTY